MDSLNLVSDINSRLSYLSNKVDVTSKSASIAFSYLYQKIEEIPDYSKDIDSMNIKISYYSNITSDNTTKIETIKADNSNYVVSINDEIINVNKEFSNIKKQIEDIQNQINEFNTKLDKIISAPEGYIVVKKEHKLLKKISDFIYRIFHQKEIQEQRRLLEEKKKQEEELKRQEEERLKKEEEKKKLAEKKKQEQSRQKIKELLGK